MQAAVDAGVVGITARSIANGDMPPPAEALRGVAGPFGQAERDWQLERLRAVLLTLDSTT